MKSIAARKRLCLMVFSITFRGEHGMYFSSGKKFISSEFTGGGFVISAVNQDNDMNQEKKQKR